MNRKKVSRNTSLNRIEQMVALESIFFKPKNFRINSTKNAKLYLTSNIVTPRGTDFKDMFNSQSQSRLDIFTPYKKERSSTGRLLSKEPLVRIKSKVTSRLNSPRYSIMNI